MSEFKKLQELVEKTHKKLQSEIIVKKGDSYQAYKEYVIRQEGENWMVVSHFSDNTTVFNMAKSALAWCIAHKFKKYELANHIKFLDSRLAAKQADIDFLTHHLKQSTIGPELKFIMQCRLSEDIFSRKSYKQQLSKCVEMTKYIKIKGSSENELRRFTKAS